MSDLHPIGPAAVRLIADLATPDDLQAEHRRVLEDFKRDRDPEGAMLRFAHLALIAIENLRVMGESHAEHSGNSRVDRADRSEPGVVRRPAGWLARQGTPGGPETSFRPH